MARVSKESYFKAVAVHRRNAICILGTSLTAVGDSSNQGQSN